MVRCPGDEFEVPDYKIYKVEDCPRLVELQNWLDRKGLKDPWIRNEAWRHNPKFFGTQRSRAAGFFLRGLKIGLMAFAVTIMMEYMASKHGKDHDKHKKKRECDDAIRP